jgi:hypothetical protein
VSNVIGWIDVDEFAWDAAIDTAHPLRRFSLLNPDEGVPMATDPANPSEFIEADFAQLQADLEAEFAGLLRRSPAD